MATTSATSSTQSSQSIDSSSSTSVTKSTDTGLAGLTPQVQYIVVDNPSSPTVCLVQADYGFDLQPYASVIAANTAVRFILELTLSPPGSDSTSNSSPDEGRLLNQAGTSQLGFGGDFGGLGPNYQYVGWSPLDSADRLRVVQSGQQLTVGFGRQFGLSHNLLMTAPGLSILGLALYAIPYVAPHPKTPMYWLAEWQKSVEYSRGDVVVTRCGSTRSAYVAESTTTAYPELSRDWTALGRMTDRASCDTWAAWILIAIGLVLIYQTWRR